MQSIQANKKKSRFRIERASAPEAERKGSITIEASIGIPIFLFAVLCLICLIEVQSIRISIINAAQNAAKNESGTTAVVPVLNTAGLRAEIINRIGTERIERSILSEGCDGIQCRGSWMIPDTGEMFIRIQYKIKIPIPILGNPSAEFREEFKMNGWRGYLERGTDDENGSIVYITENGLVYHEDPECTYLRLSINFVPFASISSLRNENGSIYRKCEICVYGSPMAGVYITETGKKYHNSLNCSSLKRTVHAVKISDVKGRGACSRCSQ